jgi:predicted short-subunit dehydrogenase-like oxidoreductase (DUF2520 family)
MRLGIIGGGRAAWAFGATWRRIGWPISGVSLRASSPSPIAPLLDVPQRSADELAHDSDLLLLAVSDRAIDGVAESLPDSRAIVFHPSGSLTSVRGGFSLHPLRALPPAGEPSDLRDALLVFEGAHRDVAKQIADAVGARFAEIAPEKKAAYHAAAVFGSNYVALMLELAETLIGIDDVRDDLVALAESAITNWRAHDDGRRFTGPAARGDRETIDRHLSALADRPEISAIYRLLADRILAARE